MVYGFTINKSYLYYAIRSIYLTAIIFFTVFWAVLGFDSTLMGLFDPDMQGIGLHWSSVQTFFITLYLLMVNFNVDGIKSFSQLKNEIILDLKGISEIIPFTPKPIGILMSKRRQRIDVITAFFYSGFIGICAFAVFEVPYVFLLNIFHFDSLLWPTYMYATNFLSFDFYLNFAFLILPIIFCWYVIKQKKGFKFRFDKYFIVLVSLTILVWFGWIVTPSTLPTVTPESLELTPYNYTFPKQDLFPQTVYTYLTVPVNTYHNDEHLNGWHQEDTITHTLNTLTKYSVFLTVTYIAMAFVSIEVKEK